jgi:hypothetical protein
MSDENRDSDAADSAAADGGFGGSISDTAVEPALDIVCRTATEPSGPRR